MIPLLSREIALFFIKPFIMLYVFLGHTLGLMTVLEIIILALFLGGIVITLALLIIMAYLLLTGKIKAVMFGVEGVDDREVKKYK